VLDRLADRSAARLDAEFPAWMHLAFGCKFAGSVRSCRNSEQQEVAIDPGGCIVKSGRSIVAGVSPVAEGFGTRARRLCPGMSPLPAESVRTIPANPGDACTVLMKCSSRLVEETIQHRLETRECPQRGWPEERRCNRAISPRTIGHQSRRRIRVETSIPGPFRRQVKPGSCSPARRLDRSVFSKSK